MKNKLPENSRLMQALLAIGKVKLAWACRRLHCPVPASALVLEVGSGGSPYFRENVLIDAYAETRERHWAPLITDRPSVLGMGEALPFKDKSFDFVIASHVLEHSADPENFLRELQRVAKAGYIETPDAFMERINPYWDHRSEVTIRNDVLKVRKKPTWRVDSELVEMYEKNAKKLIAGLVIPSNPFTFHTRFYWQDHIPFEVINPEVDSAWLPPDISHNTKPGNSLRTIFGKIMLAVVRKIFSQNKRNYGIDLKKILQCPNCKSTNIEFKKDLATCRSCQGEYHCISGIWDMSKDNNK